MGEAAMLMYLTAGAWASGDTKRKRLLDLEGYPAIVRESVRERERSAQQWTKQLAEQGCQGVVVVWIICPLVAVNWIRAHVMVGIWLSKPVTNKWREILSS
ncbi:unnamed protein product [Linum tenue]|uniref:Uncharacterized protein n=1 Tax=Linum tenue TaxID=586396 RepID=A0AAV0NTN5_9ROSI|nr:unnamed protein product [Linum tenue]